MSQNVCTSLLDILATAGVRDIFVVTSDALNTLLEAIRTDDRFRWIGVRHEAPAQAELTGGIGVSAGPGALHLINGLYNANREGADVGGPFLIDAVVSPGEFTMPPNLSIDEAWGSVASTINGKVAATSSWPICGEEEAA
ncbi:MAG: thiamine pyrophosphate-binding protein [Candidatus Binatia bacterium]|nr:thiamine pyrophosphate-binding protein [Candidatus Binatia bacterium]